MRHFLPHLLLPHRLLPHRFFVRRFKELPKPPHPVLLSALMPQNQQPSQQPNQQPSQLPRPIWSLVFMRLNGKF